MITQIIKPDYTDGKSVNKGWMMCDRSKKYALKVKRIKAKSGMEIAKIPISVIASHEPYGSGHGNLIV